MNVINKTCQTLDLKAARTGRRILCCVALLLFAGGIWGAKTAGAKTDRQMRRDLLRQTLNIAEAIPADEAARLTFTAEESGRPEFRRIAGQLKAYADYQNIRSLYTMGLRRNQIFFGPESLSPDDPYASPAGTRYENPSRLDVELFQNAQPIVQGLFDDEYGTFVSATAPVINPRTGEVILVVGCDVEASAWNRRVRKAQRTVFFLAEIPLLIMLSGWGFIRLRRRGAPDTGRRVHHTEAITCATAMLLLTLGGASVIHRADASSRQRIFNSIAQLKAEYLLTEFDNLTVSLNGLAALYESSKSVSPQEFDTYCRNLTQKPSVRGYRWIPSVPAQTADAFEEQNRKTPGLENFTIWNRNPETRPASAGSSPDYYPALYVYPQADHEHFIGFDLSSDAVRAAALKQAMSTGLTTASAPIRPISDPESPAGILICSPLKSGLQQGLVSVFVQPEIFVQQASRPSAGGSASLYADIIYLPADAPPVRLTRNRPASLGGLSLTTPVFLSGQTFAVIISPDKEWLAAHPLTMGKVTLGIGLILMALGTSLVSVLANRPVLLAELVRKRTRELHRSEQYNRAIFDSTNDAVFVHDAITMAIVDVNSAGEKMFGLSRANLLHTSLGKISSNEPPCTEEAAEARMKEALAGNPQIFDWRVKHANGSLFWTEISLHTARAGTKHYIISAMRNIEARRRVEEAIRKSEERFEIAAQAGGIGIWDLNLVTNHLTWDRRIHTIYGTHPEEFSGTYPLWLQAVHPADRERASAEMNAAQCGKSNYDTEFRIVRPNGEIRHIHSSAEIIRDEENTPLRMIGTNQDITDRKQREEQLQLIRFAVDNLNDAAYWAAENGRLVYVNTASCKSLGYTKEELLKMYVWEIDLEITPQTWHKTLTSIETRDGFVSECSHRCKNGDTIPVEVKISFIQFGETRIICGFAHDITKRTLDRKKLEESRHFLRMIIDTIPGRVWWKDLHSVFMGCNMNFAKDAGLENPEQLIGKTDYDMCWSEQADHFVEDDRKVIESGQPELGIQEFQTQTNGNTRWLETNKIPLKDSAGSIIGTVGTYSDITERKHAEMEIADLARFPKENTNPVLRLSLDGTLLYSNAAGTDLFPVMEAGPGQSVNEQWMAYIRQAREAKHPIEIEVLIESKVFSATLAPVMERNYINVYARDITERKRLQEAVEKRIIALTRPLESLDGISIDELFDMKELQKIQDEFAAATGVASIITQLDGTPITQPSNFTDLCMNIIRGTEKGRTNCFNSDATLGRHHPGGPIVRPCLSGGLWDAGAAISVGGKHIANWLIGQVRDETQTDQHMRAYAREIGADETRFIEAFHKIPSMSREQFNRISHALFTLANRLSTSAYQNMQQARFISEQKKTEHELNELTDIQSLILNNSSLGIALIENRRFKWVNPRLSELLHIPIHEFENASTRILYPTEEAYQETGKKAYLTLQEGKRFEETLQFKQLDGTLFWCRLIVKALDPKNPHESGSLWMFEDITAQKTAQDNLLRLSTAIEQSPETIMIFSPLGIIEYVNPAFETTTGYSRQEAIGRHVSFLGSGEHDESYFTGLLKTLKSGSVWEGRFINKRKDGTFFTEETSISPVKNKEGVITNFVSIQRDITEELKLEEQLQQAQKMEAVGQLAGGIAHDFNNILQAILGFSELLMLTLDETDDDARENVQEIQKAGQHAADLTRQLLAFSRKEPVQFGPLDLNSVLAESGRILTSIAGENVRILNDLQADLVQINADKRQVERMIVNLCVNARDAMPNGGELTLRTRNARFSAEDAASSPETQPGEFACLSVSDTGTGMSADIIKHIFEPFFSTKAPGKGTGLGLAAIYGIIQEHKGWIHVYSEIGRGSTFKIYLPALKQQTSEKHGINISEAAQTPAGTEHILVVEDDPVVRNLSKTALERAGYRITEAKSAEEAEQLFDAAGGTFDLLFSDVILPAKNGADLAATILEKKPDLPVLLCSGYSGDRIANAGIESKGFHFLEKPFTIMHLIQTIHHILAEKR